MLCVRSVLSCAKLNKTALVKAGVDSKEGYL